MNAERNTIRVAKATLCPRCNSFIYHLPVAIDATVAESLVLFGNPVYPLDKFKILKIESEGIAIDSSLGKKEVRVKFKKNAVSMSALFRASLLSWVESKVGPTDYIGTP
jgi:hypothetical protein